MEVGSQDLAVDPSNLRCTSADTKRRNSTVSKMIENTHRLGRISEVEGVQEEELATVSSGSHE